MLSSDLILFYIENNHQDKPSYHLSFSYYNIIGISTAMYAYIRNILIGSKDASVFKKLSLLIRYWDQTGLRKECVLW